MKRTRGRARYCNVRVTADAKTVSKLCYIAQCEGRSLSGQVWHVVLRMVQAFEAEHGPIDIAANRGTGNGKVT